MDVLSGKVRILDLTDEMGVYTTKLFAELGAEVIRVEPVEGSEVVRRAPHLDTEENSSAFHAFMNQNKKSLALNLRHSEGQELLRELWKKCHILVWSSLEGINDEHWELINSMRGDQTKVVTLITPFGLDGPYRELPSSDLVNMALGGFLSLSGYPDHPIVPFGEQSFYATSLHAAVGTSVAIYHMRESGRGQEVRVAAQEAVAHSLENAPQYVNLEGIVRSPIGDEDPEAGSGTFACQDGYVFLMSSLAGSLLRWDELTQWLGDEDSPRSEELLEDHWTEDKAFRNTDEAKALFREIFEEFSKNHTKQDLYFEGQERGVNICPLNTPEDAAASPQLREREFFQRATGSNSNDGLTFPGPPFRFAGFEPRHEPAGEPGRDNAELFGELGLSPNSANGSESGEE